MVFTGSPIISFLCLLFNITLELHEQETVSLVVEYQLVVYIFSLVGPLFAIALSSTIAFAPDSWCRANSIWIRVLIMITLFIVLSLIFSFIIFIFSCPCCSGLEAFVERFRTLDKQNQPIVK